MTPKDFSLFLRKPAYLLLIAGGGVALGLLGHRLDSPPSTPFPLPAHSLTQTSPQIAPSPNPFPIVSQEPSTSLSNVEPKAAADTPAQTRSVQPVRAQATPVNTPASLEGNLLGPMSPSLTRMVYRNGTHGVLPAVLAEPPEDLTLTAEQAARLDKLAEEFIAAVGGPNQDPTDPAYKKRWQEAQWLSDQEFEAYFGNQVFAEMQKRAYLQTMQSATSR